MEERLDAIDGNHSLSYRLSIGKLEAHSKFIEGESSNKKQLEDRISSFKEELESQLDESIAKQNDLDARISSLEERDFKSQVTEEDKISPRNEHLAGQMEEIKLQLSVKFETLGVHSREIQHLLSSVESLKRN